MFGGGGPFGGHRQKPKTRGHDRIEQLDVSLNDFYNCSNIDVNLKKCINKWSDSGSLT